MPSAKRRKRLKKIINQMYQYDTATRNFAEVLDGRKEEVIIGHVQRDTAKFYGVKPKSKIFLKKSYVLHMDNSGHFMGTGYGKHAHNDKRPLTLTQISQIPDTIKTAQKSEIFYRGVVRGSQRLMVMRKIEKNCLIIIEISKHKNQIDLVSAYNITDMRAKEIIKKRNSR